MKALRPESGTRSLRAPVISLGLLATLLTSGPLAPLLQAAEKSSEPCAQALDLGAARRKTQVTVNEKGGLVFTDEARAHFTKSREALRQLVSRAQGKMVESEYAIRRLILARMLGKHAFLMGDPGASKSGLSRMFLGSSQFKIQLNQLLGDDVIRGYLDTEKLRNGVKITRDMVNTSGTVVEFETALIDEVDKGNPAALAAFLDILNEKVAQYGPLTIRVKTRTVFATSNMNLYEFLQSFKDAGLESTARPILDRFTFIIYMHNFLTTPELRQAALQIGWDRTRSKAFESLVPSAASDQAATPVADAFEESDLTFLGNLSQIGIRIPEAVTAAAVEMLDSMQTSFNQLRRESEAAVKSGKSPGPVYYPPFLFSTRKIMETWSSVPTASAFLDLLLLPEDRLPTGMLLKQLEGGKLSLEVASLYRLSETVLTAAVGDARLVYPTMDQQGVAPRVEFGRNISVLLEDPFDSRQQRMLTEMQQEREIFERIFNGVVATSYERRANISATMANLGATLRGMGIAMPAATTANYSLVESALQALWDGSAPLARAEAVTAASAKRNLPRPRLSTTQIDAIRAEREDLRQLLASLEGKYFEVDHAIRRLVLARLMETHAFLMGDPGASKSGLARLFLGMPTDTFRIQLNQLLGDENLRGFVDIRSQAAGQVVTESDIHNGGAMVRFSTALLDEIDKGNPAALAALLDILNERVAQYGAVTVQARTKTVVATSNMSLYELLDSFKSAGLESTARAIIDRFIYTVYMHNRITDPLLRRQALKQAHSRTQQRIAGEMSQGSPAVDGAALEEVIDNAGSSVDFSLLGSLAAYIEVPEPVIASTDSLLVQLRKAFHSMRRESESMVTNGDAEGPVYFPPYIFSTRKNMETLVQNMATSTLLDLLLLPESVLSTSQLVSALQNGRVGLESASLWRLSEVMLTGAVGDPSAAFTDGGESPVTLTFGKQLDKLLESPFDDRQERMIRQIIEERESFRSAYESEMKKSADVAEPWDGDPARAERYIQFQKSQAKGGN